MPDTLTSLLIAPVSAPGLDVLTIHAAADREADEIYRLQTNISHGLMALLEIGKGICMEPDDLAKLRFVIGALADANDKLLYTNDRLCNAIDPLNPTVLSDGSSQ